MSIDVHRHICTERLTAELARRADPPRLRRRARRWHIEVAGEVAAMPPLPEGPPDVLADLRSFGLARGVVALSPALGAEQLPEDDARSVVDAWHADCAELPAELAAWGSMPLADPALEDVDAAVAGGRLGLCVPATALATPQDLDRLGAVLERLEGRDGVLFVHPGPARAGDWLPAVTSYPASLVGAWIAWAAHGRRAHPRLTVLFAALAGLAPLHAERIAARVDPEVARGALCDPRTFYDTSSYGPAAVAAVAGVVGEERIVYGSDRPWAGAPGEHRLLPPAVSGRNAGRLFAGTGRWPA